MSRNGKVVVRPDTGDPVKIVTGYFVKEVNKTLEEIRSCVNTAAGYMRIWNDIYYDCVKTSDGYYMDQNKEVLTEEEVKGSIHVLYENFGGIVNSKGYVELDSHIGLIYGDSITYDRCKQICERLKRKGFASTNVVYGIGSYTYQYVTRDTYSLACKATWVQINGKPKDIFKDPKTGDGMKKSAKGLLTVKKEDGRLVLKEKCTPDEEKSGELQTVFENGKVLVKESLSGVRDRLSKYF
jgi:nicotinamide phosphoribosyltransferase